MSKTSITEQLRNHRLGVMSRVTDFKLAKTQESLGFLKEIYCEKDSVLDKDNDCFKGDYDEISELQNQLRSETRKLNRTKEVQKYLKLTKNTTKKRLKTMKKKVTDFRNKLFLSTKVMKYRKKHSRNAVLKSQQTMNKTMMSIYRKSKTAQTPRGHECFAPKGLFIED